MGCRKLFNEVAEATRVFDHRAAVRGVLLLLLLKLLLLLLLLLLRECCCCCCCVVDLVLREDVRVERIGTEKVQSPPAPPPSPPPP
jgi:hypothetical protein